MRYLGLFWDMYLPCGEAPSEYYQRHCAGGWTTFARENYKADPALYRALLAMGLTALGYQQDNQPLREEGLRQYGKALGEMKSGLRSPKRQRSDAMLVASRTLGLYEMMFGNDERTQQVVTQANSWQGHNLGEMALVSMRTPESQIDDPAHSLFCDGRMGHIIASINMRKRCILSEPRWKTVPWAKIPKTPKDMLWDTIVDIPGLLESVDLLQTLPDGPHKADLYQSLIAECWRLHGELVWWHDTLCPRDQFEQLEARGFGAPDPSADDQATASVIINYWTGCLLVYANLRGLLSAHPALASTIASMPPSTDPMHYCDRIGDLIDFFLHPSAGRFSWHQTPFPIGIASGYLLTSGQIYSPQMAKIVRFWSRDDGGRQVALFLKSMLDSGYGTWPTDMGGKDGEGPDVKTVVMRNLAGLTAYDTPTS